ncbi:MAG: heme-binding protein [Sphingomonas sp.]
MRLLLAVPLLLAAAPVPADSPADLDAAAARAMVDGCAAVAAARQGSQAIAVVDLGGHPVATLRMDGNGWGVMDLALAKARAAAAWGFTTAGMAMGAARTPGFADAPNVVIVAGGIPVWSADGSRRIGAIGVSGGSAEDDVACAEAGVKAAGLRTARAR